MDDVARHYNFNDHASARLTTSIKDVLDPKGILSPGKQGVWNSKGPNPAKL
jgi:4-cresol dehydrogenase (hydroxylating)